MQAVTDEQLIQWVANGDNSCLGTLFERHHRSVYQYCYQLTRQSELSEDLVQDVFLKVLRKAGSFRGKGSFKAWMFSITRNLAFDCLRKVKHTDALVTDSDPVGHALIDSRSPEQSAAGKQRIDLVAQALSKLPTAAKEVIWLGRFEFDGYEELALALGCSPGTARVRMHRAMQQLNVAVERLQGTRTDD